MSKQPSQPQFNSGLNQSLQGLSLSGVNSSSPSSPAPASPVRRQMTIEYKELKYDSTKPLGRGAYGEVFAGQFRKETVAIKVYDFKGHLSAQEQTEVLQEAALMEGLRSKFLVGYRGVCWDPRYCLVMEFCEGGTLRARLDNAKILTLPEQLRWAMQISYGVYQLHSVKIVHRDLKSENILLDAQGNAKVADFGLSVVKSSSASQSKKGGNVAGTLPWMAPELFKRKPQNAASDVYSLGMVLWEIIGRQHPFAGVMPAAVAGMVSTGEREIVEESWPLVFKTLIQACWDADPTKRPTAEKVGDELGAALNSLEAGPKAISKSAAEWELEKVKEQLRQSELRRQKLEEKAALSAWSKSPALPQPVPASQNAHSILPAPKPMLQSEPVVGAKALGQLLRLVAEGEQDQAEALIKRNKQLLLASGEVTDLSGRTFQNITAFQYALWAMDYHMWTMIKNYLPVEAQVEQLNCLESKGTEHDQHYDLKPLIGALQTYVDNAEKWGYDQRAEQLCKGVGGAQRLVPAHVVNEYVHPDRPFDPCPTEWESKLPRSGSFWDRFQFKRVKGDWFTAPLARNALGRDFAWTRGRYVQIYQEWGTGLFIDLRLIPGNVLGRLAPDLKALQSLWKTRTQQLELLKSQLASAASQSQRFGLG